jgi:hypothetical protein
MKWLMNVNTSHAENWSFLDVLLGEHSCCAQSRLLPDLCQHTWTVLRQAIEMWEVLYSESSNTAALGDVD